MEYTFEEVFGLYESGFEIKSLESNINYIKENGTDYCYYKNKEDKEIIESISIYEIRGLWTCDCKL